MSKKMEDIVNIIEMYNKDSDKYLGRGLFFPYGISGKEIYKHFQEVKEQVKKRRNDEK